MRERWTTLVGGAVSLLLIVLLLVPGGGDTKKLSRPTSIDEGVHGFAGLERWLSANGVPTYSLRRRYTHLDETSDELAGTGNVLIASFPERRASTWREREVLEEWLYRGNSMIALVALEDMPAWTSTADEAWDILWSLGVTFESPLPSEDTPGPESWRERLTTVGRVLAGLERIEVVTRAAVSHPAVTDVVRVETHAMRIWNDPTRLLDPPCCELALTLMVDAETEQGVLWQVSYGNGTLWVSAYSDLFGNQMLGRADNARLIANLLGLGLGEGGSVLFDDMHMGLTDLYDPEAFFADRRLHNTLLFVLGLWLLYLLGRAPRLAPVRTPEQAPRAAQFVESIAGLFARRLSSATVARGLFATLFDEVRRRFRLPQDGEPCWSLIGERLHIQTATLERLQHIHQTAVNDRRVDLVALCGLLDQVRAKLR